MKTKEYPCFIHKDALDNEVYFEVFIDPNVSKREFVKARLIIEMPEKKIEISESEFDKASREAMTECLEWPHVVDNLKQKLFRDEK